MSTNLVALYTIARKEITRILRIWKQTVFPPIITMSLYFLIFGKVIGERISMAGMPYIEFIVPGLIMLSIIRNAYMNTSSSFFGSKFQRNIDELLVSPTPAWVIITGYTLGGIFRALLVGLVVWMVSFFFTSVQPVYPLVVLGYAISTALVFSFAGLINGLYAKKFDDVSIIPTFVLTPMTYLGGIFYSLDSLPPLFATISKFNPMVYMVAGLRYGFLGIQETPAYVSLGVLTISAIVLYGICVWLIATGKGLKN